jgi:hypothetical protein
MKYKIDSIINLQKFNDSLGILKQNLQDTLLQVENNKIFEKSSTTQSNTIGISVLVSIGIFIVGRFIAWYKTKSEKRNEIIAYRNTILVWIKLIDKAVEQRANSCEDFCGRLVKSDRFSTEKFNYNRLFADKLEAITIDKYINIFVTNSKGKEDVKEKLCFNLYAKLAFLKDIEEKMDSDYVLYHEKAEKIIDEWNSNFAKLHNVINQETKLNPSSPSEFHTKVLRIRKEFHVNVQDKTLLNSVTTHLIEPLIEICETETDQTTYLFDLIACLQELKITGRKWEANKKGYLDIFVQNNSEMKRKHTELKTIKENIINQTKVKCVFRIK